MIAYRQETRDSPVSHVFLSLCKQDTDDPFCNAARRPGDHWRPPDCKMLHIPVCYNTRLVCLFIFVLVTRPGITQASVNTYFHCSLRDRPLGTLRVVTARGLVILSGSFTSHSKSVRWLSHLRGHVSHERYTVSNVEGREINLRVFHFRTSRWRISLSRRRWARCYAT